MEQESTNGKNCRVNFFAWFLVRQHFLVQVSIRIAIIPQVLQCYYRQLPPRKTSSRSAFNIEQVSILCRIRDHSIVQVSIRIPIIPQVLQCYYRQLPPRKTSSRSAFNVEQASILCRIREHSIVQVSIRIPIISLCRSAFDHTSSVSMLLPPITLLGKHQAGQHLTSNRSAFHIPLRQRFAVQMQRSIRSLPLLSPSLSY